MTTKVDGELSRSFDPSVSEWKNPSSFAGEFIPKFPIYRIIKSKQGTGGTETSKYPEEYKSNEISLVAASESEQA